MKKILFFASAVALLASCSKELTESMSPAQADGKSTVIATFDAGDDVTRSFATPNGSKYDFTWEDGDALGIFNYNEDALEDDANAYFGYASAKEGNAAEFKGDLGFLAKGQYVGYYPYADGREIDEVGNITLTIPTKQNYRFNAKSTAGSFAANVAPSVAFGTATEDGTLDLTFHAVATYLRVPFVGYGTVKTIKLKIYDDAGVARKIAGNFTANVEDIAAAEKSADIVLNIEGLTKSEITLNCGKGVELKPTEPTYFWFVVPAGVEAGKFRFYINGEEEKYLERKMNAANETPVNTPILLYNNEGKPFQWVDGGAYLITNEYEFLMYAFAATNGVDAKTTYAPMLNDSKDGLRDAVIFADLDFKSIAEGGKFDPDPTVSVVDVYGGYLKTVMTAYQANKGITTIGEGDGAVVYSITGNVKVEGEDKPAAAKIANLTVTGDKGIFGVANQPSVSNIELVDVNVISKSTDVSNVTFVMDAFKTGSTVNGEFENIIVNGGNLSVASETAKTAIVRHLYISELSNSALPVSVTKYPTNVAHYATTLYVDKKGVTTLDKEYVTAESIAFATVVSHDSGKGGIVNIAEGEAAAKNFISAVSVSSTRWFSVVTGYDAEEKTVETSYWTGMTADAVNADGIFTAEELALAVKERQNIVLTNNVDLMNRDWSANVGDWNKSDLISVTSAQPVAAAAATPAPATVYSVNNVTLAPAATSTAAFLTLFGFQANITNVNVGEITITATDGAFVSGLAIDGTAENVAVAKVTVNNAAKVAKNSFVGGLFMRTTKVNKVTATDFTATDAKVAGNIAGQLRLLDVKAAEFKFDGVKSGSQKTFGLIEVALPENEKQTWTDVTFTNYAGSMDIKDFYVDGKKAHIINLSINGKAGTLYTINPLTK